MDPCTDVPTIPEFYRDEVIFITGATGFIGKALVEKLLRSCSELGIIYIVLRKKRGMTPQERWAQIKENEVFAWLRNHRPELLDKKVVALEGDMRDLRLGLRDEDYNLLQKTATQIFHVAATVRFDEPITDAILMNARGTRETLHLAMDCKELKAFIHVSTCFTNPHQKTSEEVVYPPPANWREAIRAAETIDPLQLTKIQLKYLGRHPNSYTFTKNLAESMVWEYRDKVPVLIMRPSIVVGAAKEPFPGFVDNLNGPVGLMIGVAKGVMRVALKRKDYFADHVPVDAVIEGMIAGAWFIATRPLQDVMRVFNLTSPGTELMGNDFLELMSFIENLIPLQVQHLITTSCQFVPTVLEYKIKSALYQVVPSILIDTAIKLSRRKPLNLLKIQMKIVKVMEALKHFSLSDWYFPNPNTRFLKSRILPEDKDAFDNALVDMDMQDFSSTAAHEGLIRFGGGENNNKYFERSLKTRRRALFLNFIVKTTFEALVIWKAYTYSTQIDCQ